jgi:hypothetical protein
MPVLCSRHIHSGLVTGSGLKGNDLGERIILYDRACAVDVDLPS